MKVTSLAAAILVASLCAVPSLSRAADAGGFFVNGGVGQATTDKGIYNDNDFAFIGNIGYRWAFSEAGAFGVEGGFTDFGHVQPKSGYSALGLSKAQNDGWTLGVNGHFNFTPEWYVSGRFGGYFANLKGSYYPSGVVVNPPVAVNVSGNSSDYYFGAGFGYDISKQASIGFNYDYYKASKSGLTLDPYVLSVNGELRF